MKPFKPILVAEKHLSELTGQKSGEKTDIRATTYNPFERKCNNPFEREKKLFRQPDIKPVVPCSPQVDGSRFLSRMFLVLFIKNQRYYKSLIWVIYRSACTIVITSVVNVCMSVYTWFVTKLDSHFKRRDKLLTKRTQYDSQHSIVLCFKYHCPCLGVCNQDSVYIR